MTRREKFKEMGHDQIPGCPGVFGIGPNRLSVECLSYEGCTECLNAEADECEKAENEKTEKTTAEIEILRAPTKEDWELCYSLAIGTEGKLNVGGEPTEEWKRRILASEHSPIRVLNFAISAKIPSWVATHLTRHKVGIEHFVASQRNDRQKKYDRNAARQDALVLYRAFLNAQTLMTICRKRLCALASEETRSVVQEIANAVENKCPEFKGLLVPMCEYRNGMCTEFKPCGKRGK